MIGDEHAYQEHQGHGREDRPALPLVADHLAESVSEARGNQEDHQRFHEIAERRWIFVWVRGVRVHKAAAVGADHLDGFLRSHRALRDGLCSTFYSGDLGIRAEILNHASRTEIQSSNERKRQQHVERGARQIRPKVADRLCLLAGESADHRNGDRDTDRGRGEVIHGQSNHLREVTHGRFTRVGLPVRVC